MDGDPQHAGIGLGNYFQMWGYLLVAVGVGLGGWAYFFFDTSLAAPSGMGVDRIANLDLMQRQLLVFVGAAAGLLAGVICLAAGGIISTLARLSPSTPS